MYYIGGDCISAKRSKYNVDLRNKEKRTYDGIVFDSAGEMRMYRDYLLPLKEQGQITDIQRQVEYVLQEGFHTLTGYIRPIIYVADFVVTADNGSITVFDFKGMPDAVAKLKRKMFIKCYPGLTLVWMAYSKIDGGFVPYETVQRNRRQRAKARQNRSN